MDSTLNPSNDGISKRLPSTMGSSAPQISNEDDRIRRGNSVSGDMGMSERKHGRKESAHSQDIASHVQEEDISQTSESREQLLLSLSSQSTLQNWPLNLDDRLGRTALEREAALFGTGSDARSRFSNTSKAVHTEPGSRGRTETPSQSEGSNAPTTEPTATKAPLDKTGRGGRMSGWWVCCRCNHVNNLAISGFRCPIDHHKRCETCNEYR